MLAAGMLLRGRPIVALVFLTTFPARATFGLDPQRAPSQYVITKWGAGTLPNGAVHALHQTPDHYLWLGTPAGLVRFDGSRFVLFNARETPGFAEGGVMRLAGASDGSFLLATTSGTVLRHHNGAFETFFTAPNSAPVSSMLAARDGSVWTSVWANATRRWPAVDGKPHEIPGLGFPMAMADGPDGRIWIGTHRRGLVVYDGATLNAQHEITHDLIQALAFDRKGVLWIGTPHGLLRWDGGRAQLITRRDGLSDENVTTILEDRDGNLWVGTLNGGLNRLSGGEWRHLTAAEGLADDDVQCLLEDHEGNLWVGTPSGLCALGNSRFVTYTRTEGLPEDSVVSVTPAAAGGVWAGTASGQVTRIGSGAAAVQLPRGVGRPSVIGLREMRDGSLWIASDDARLFRLQAGRLTEHTPTGATPISRVTILAEDERGPFFFANGIGFVRLDGRKPRTLDSPSRSGTEPGYPHCSHRQDDGTLWLGSTAGLTRYRGGTRKTWTTREGLPHDRVRSISVEAGGRVWVATARGLALLDGEVIRAATTEHGLPENYLRLVLDDGLGHLWVASTGYLFRLDKQELLDLFSGGRRAISPLIFDTSDGLRTTSAGLAGNAPGCRTADGRLWFATAKGVSVVDPARIPSLEPSPHAFIEEVTVDRHSARSLAPDAEFGPGRGEVAIDYTALSYAAPGKIRFRCRLEGLDQEWVDVGTQRRAYYSTLPPGRYRFQVMASNRDGVWNGEVSSASFALRRPFHDTPAFYAACLLGALAALTAAYKVRVRQVRTRHAAVLAERTRLARELHDTLAQGLAGAKLHLESALQTIDGQPEAARGFLKFGSTLLVASLAEVRRSIWILRAHARKDGAGLGPALSRSLEALFTHAGVAHRVTVRGAARALPAATEHHVLRIAHEAVTNAVRHAKAGTIAVHLEFGAEALELQVEDDGAGFDPVPYLEGRGGDHFGLLGLHERTQALGGTLDLRSAPGQGTRLRCRLPYHESPR